jgi:hypothetical protein
MPETEHGNQIEQDEIAQPERSDELRFGRFRSHNLQEGRKMKCCEDCRFNPALFNITWRIA